MEEKPIGTPSNKGFSGEGLFSPLFTTVLTAVYVNTPGPESTQMCCTGLVWTVCVLLGLRNPHGDNK